MQCLCARVCIWVPVYLRMCMPVCRRRCYRKAMARMLYPWENVDGWTLTLTL